MKRNTPAANSESSPAATDAAAVLKGSPATRSSSIETKQPGQLGVERRRALKQLTWAVPAIVASATVRAQAQTSCLPCLPDDEE
ncbi:MAG: hypothetical protein MK135_15980 [Polyangiaceae bacterium]|nr:hypothetical protein [Polyangiaceae bacterium]